MTHDHLRNIHGPIGGCILKDDLWASTPKERLRAARSLPADELAQIHKALGEHCPVEPWPYGNATVINPFLVTLGVSPGGSPAAGDTKAPAIGGDPLPTAGKPHPGTYYRDTRGYWDKVRLLARLTVMGQATDENESLSLFGNLNLDTGQSGEARNVAVKFDFAAWILRAIRYGLRPRFVVMFGLSTYLRTNHGTAEILEDVFPGFDLKKPHREVSFSAYSQKNLVFREWDIPFANGDELTLVMWPQHPSRAPFSNAELWRASCEEFAVRHRLPLGC